MVNNSSSNVTILLDFDGTRFAAERYVAVGILPNSVASGDVDGDGDLDLVVSNEWNNSVSILRNDGQGGFSAAAAPAVGNHPFAVATGDFNQDGQLDLAVADYGTHPSGGDLGDVRVLLADGSGSFQSRIACPVGFGPAALVAADLDDDGHLDLAVANFLSDNVTVCRGSADGTFTRVATLPGGSGPMDIDATELDGDGDLDLLVTNGKSKKVGILRNRLSQGVFEFEPAESFGVANFPGASQISLATGDLDGNGTADVALAHSQENSVSVLLNTLVGGAYRVALTGVETVTGMDFAFQPVNLPPTLDAIASPLVIDEDAPVQTVALTGITAGTGETQALAVQASSDQPGLTGSPTVSYSSPDAVGFVHFTPQPDQYGTAVVTVTVSDAGLDGTVGTADDGISGRSFTVTVRALNDPPTLAGIADQTSNEDAGEQTVSLAGISAGGGEPEQQQLVRVSAATNNPELITGLAVEYTSGQATGVVRYRSAADQSGTGLVTVTVEDSGLDGNLETAADNGVFARIFAVTVRAVNDPPTLEPLAGPLFIDEDAPEQTVPLSGISDGGDGGETLTVTAASSDPAVIPQPGVHYVPSQASGTITFRPAANAAGTVILTVTVTDHGGTAYGGEDSVSRSITVHVRP